MRSDDAQETRGAIVWLFDEAAEAKFPVSLGSLYRNGGDAWNRFPKIVIDLGLSPPMREWIATLRSRGVWLAEYPPVSEGLTIGRNPSKPARILRTRILLSSIIEELARADRVPAVDCFLHVDTDTVFQGSPSGLIDLEWSGEHIRAVMEWDWLGDPALNEQRPMVFERDSAFLLPLESGASVTAHALGLQAGELGSIPTYNAGVWAARPGPALSERWVASYNRLAAIDRRYECGLLNPYCAEENALAIGIYQGAILCRPVDRRYNQFPPRPPNIWPADTVISHFVTFHRNCREERYAPWFEARRAVLDDCWCPASLVDLGGATLAPRQ